MESHNSAGLPPPVAAKLRRLSDLPGPKSLPLVGNTLQFKPELVHQQLETWAKQYGNCYRISLGPHPYLVCASPNLVASVLKNRPSLFRRSSRLEMVLREMATAGVFSAHGDEWKRQRTLVMAAFNPAHVKAYFPSLRTVTERLLRRWRKYAASSQSFSLTPELMRYTVDVTTGLAFGTDINTIESDEVVMQQQLNDIFRMMHKRVYAPFPYWHWVRFAEDKRLDANIKAVIETVHEFIQAAQQRMKAEPTRYARPENLLEAMIAARDESYRALSDDELAGNVLTMLLAGEDTTAHTLAWLIYFLSCHPGYCQQIRDEVDAVLDNSPFPTEHRQLEQLNFLEACLHEAMRLKPIAPVIVAEAVEDTSVGEVSLKRGTPILLLTRAGAVDAMNFNEPNTFRPERWLGDPTEANHRKVSIPFGSGPRICPGRYLALEEMKMLIAMLVANFDLVGVNTFDGKEAQECLTFTMAPLNLSAVLKRRA